MLQSSKIKYPCLLAGSLTVGLPDLANKNTGHSVQFEFRIDNNFFYSVSIFHAIFGI